ncbi:hypothetical protein LEP1GSC125_3056 [Leptospira mayottensis 200901122]|uniref:Uncharacterized protein n=1 Tax=Leptospira mayottensis 200901122 TaxID=1193010 RepID=A0AA87MM79_9LEPT|nr:hypothetical protein LEP1GSC125_3056 [Leptospira mayottensis 200901122]
MKKKNFKFRNLCLNVDLLLQQFLFILTKSGPLNFPLGTAFKEVKNERYNRSKSRKMDEVDFKKK